MRTAGLAFALVVALGACGEPAVTAPRPPRPPVEAPPIPPEDPAAVALLEELRARLFERPFYAVGRLRVQRPGVDRELLVRIHYRGPAHTLVRADRSERDGGLTILGLDGRVHLWFPRAELRMELPPSMGSDRLLGSDFAMDDIASLGGDPERFAAALDGTGDVRGETCDRIVLRPRRADASLYSAMRLWLTRDGRLPVRQEFVSDRGEVVRVVELENTVEEVPFPTRWTARTLGGAPSESVMTFRFFEQDPPVDARHFTLEGLTGWR